MFSDMDVKPLISVNSIVTFLNSPPRFSPSLESSNLSTICLETYLLKVFLILFCWVISSMAITVPVMAISLPILGDTEIFTTDSFETVEKGIFCSD